MRRLLFFRYLSLVIFLSVLLFAYTSLQGQSTANAGFKHVRIDIAHGGLHCPFLGPQLESKIKALPGAQNVKRFVEESYMTFELPVASTIIEAQLKIIPVKIGYPESDVKVTMLQ